MDTYMDLTFGWDTLSADTVTVVESISDAFVKCMNDKGYVDISYIASLAHASADEVTESLRGSIYQNPNKWKASDETLGWETAEEYLSGNVRKKLQDAKSYNRMYPDRFNENIEALEKVLPRQISSDEIYVTIGSPWLPGYIYREFVDGRPVRFDHNHYKGMADYRDDFVYDEITGVWSYADKEFKDAVEISLTRYRTTGMKAADLLIRTMNMQSVAVMRTEKTNTTKSGRRSVVDKGETVLALEKQKQLIGDFRKWIWNDPDRKKDLVEIYEEKYASVRNRHYDGGFLQLPGLNPAITLYPYQKNAVARILFSPNTLLAHDVGAGKTYIMIVAGMELKRLGMSEKNMYVVPNNLVGQWFGFFRKLYPNSNVRCIEPKGFTPAKRKYVLEDIRDNDYDAIVIAYSCFNQIGISNEHELKSLFEEKKKLGKILTDTDEYVTGTRIFFFGARRRRRNPIWKINQQRYVKVCEQIAELEEKAKELDPESEALCFDKLGVTRLFVDEAHNFKNVPIATKITNVMGISSTGSAKCKDMMIKVRIVQEANNGGGVIFATGTPITNSITDAYIMQKYLQNGDLKIMNLDTFDSWIGMFAEKTENFEVDVDTSKFRLATRFARFHNIPTLATMLVSVADFHQMDHDIGIPDHDGFEDVVIKKTDAFKRYLEEISIRADAVRNYRVDRTVDNMLKITTDGRKAALDIRLAVDDAKFSTESKVYACARRVCRIYLETFDKRSTQLVFCDTSTPKEGFNIYDELRRLLTDMGIPKEEIAYIHSATTEAKRDKLYEDTRQGRIRVLIGSTFKLGLGVNVQNKLIALHHLDVPWRPADMVQREGRILRQGNENPKVRIFRYITEGSFDAYSWQLLETKQQFITDLLSGTADGDAVSDIDDTVLDYAEVKALAIGEPLIRERVEVANELSRYVILQKKYVVQREMDEYELSCLPERIEKIRDHLPTLQSDAEFYEKNKREYTSDERRHLRGIIFRAFHNEDEVSNEDVSIAVYQGFEIIVPGNVSMEHPMVILRRSGNYMVELGSSDVGVLTRIDNKLNNLMPQYLETDSRIAGLNARIEALEKNLEHEEDYTERIESLRNRLKYIDKKLGVKIEGGA